MDAGQLNENPLAELIREIVEKTTSGALRLSRNRAKAVIYFEEGEIVFAASNVRAHRLSEFLKRNRLISDEDFAALPPAATDQELSDLLVKRSGITPEALKGIRSNHISDIVRSALLWTDGDWQFDSRVRMAGDTRVPVDCKRLLLESARHLPTDYVASRFRDMAEPIELAQHNGWSGKLVPGEAFVLSRVSGPMVLKELLAVSGLSAEETLRVVYGLALSGLLRRGAWLPAGISGTAAAPAAQPSPAPRNDEVSESELQELFARLKTSSDHYQVLGIGSGASADEVKNAYHALARRYHPDRFHQSDARLRSQIDSSFATIARAYETLGDQALRAAYDARFSTKAAGVSDSPPPPPRETARKVSTPQSERAEASFQQGLAAMKQKQYGAALRFFAEAASLEPRQARYRAEYGRALIFEPQTRRIAEIELKAAVALEPDNASYRTMLAELYKVLGLRRRAEGEIRKALIADPKNEAARLLLASLNQ